MLRPVPAGGGFPDERRAGTLPRPTDVQQRSAMAAPEVRQAATADLDRARALEERVATTAARCSRRAGVDRAFDRALRAAIGGDR